MRTILIVIAVAGFVAGTARLAGAQVVGTQQKEGPGLLSLVDNDPVSSLLERSDTLKLTDDQKASLMDIRRRLRGLNEPLEKELDSLKLLTGVPLDPREHPSRINQGAVQRYEKLSQPVRDSIRANNQAAQVESRSVLQPAQLIRLDSLASRSRNAGSRGRRGGGPGSRPPTG